MPGISVSRFAWIPVAAMRSETHSDTSTSSVIGLRERRATVGWLILHRNLGAVQIRAKWKGRGERNSAMKRRKRREDTVGKRLNGRPLSNAAPPAPQHGKLSGLSFGGFAIAIAILCYCDDEAVLRSIAML